MPDQHNSNIPALPNQIASDIPDIKENLEYHKDVFQNFVQNWSDTTATDIFPYKIQDSGKTYNVEATTDGIKFTPTSSGTQHLITNYVRRYALLLG